MTNYEFTKPGIKKMYDNVIDDCFKAMETNDIDKITIKIQIGDHQIEMPISADSVESIFEVIKECEQEDL